MVEPHLILAAGALLAVGILASLLAGRMRVPALVLFLGLGMLVGSDGIGWIRFDNYELTQAIGVIALALILYEGGLAAGYAEIRPVLWPAISLAILGTLATALMTGLVATWIFHFSMLEGLLLGSILAATDGAAIFAVLRGSSLRRRLARTLEGEAGLNDPIAILLVLGFIEWIQQPDYGLPDMLALFASELAIGAAAGLAIGRLAVLGFRRARLASPGLYPVASLATAALAFGAAETLHGSGFLAVYLAGLTLGSAPIPARRTVAAFHDGLAWVAQVSMFFALGLLVFPTQLDNVILEGTLLALVLVLVARPVATFLATFLGGYSLAERFILGWAGLRGGIPVVLATFPVIAGIEHSLEFFNITFFAVVLSTLLQGATFEPLARRLGLTTSRPALPGDPQRLARSHPAISTVRPWQAQDGDPAMPTEIMGAKVIEHLRTRQDTPGALLYLDDGRYAVSGPVLVIGDRASIQRHARRRLVLTRDEYEQLWWQEVTGAIAVRH